MKLQPCGIQTELSHSVTTVQAKKFQITGEKLAEGARFELADPLRGLRFSRPTPPENTLRITAWQRTNFSALQWDRDI